MILVNNNFKYFVTATFSLFLLSCGESNPYKELSLSKEQHQVSETQLAFQRKAPIYLKVHKTKDSRLSKKINVSGKNVTVLATLNSIDPTLSIAAYENVDLNKRVNVKFVNRSFEDYLTYLSDITDYHFSFNEGVVTVKSLEEKTWNLQSLSMEQVRAEHGTSIGVSVSPGDADGASAWNDILDKLRGILGSEAVVLDNKQLGIVTAIASPQNIRKADEWITQIIQSSNKQIHLNVKVLDVEVDENVGSGINWDLISDASSAPLRLSNDSSQTIDGAGNLTFRTAAGSALDLGSNLSLSFVLNFLRSQGKVKVENQPNITVANGRTAFISTGDEFSYISEIDVNVDNSDSGSVTTTDIDVEETSVGVQMQVTPKIIDNDRVVISVVPVVSSVKSFTDLSAGSVDGVEQTFRTPNIALQSLATQVIVNSGETIHLGGLIAEKISNAARGLPEDNILSKIFSGEQKNLERREIVILITPTIVEL